MARFVRGRLASDSTLKKRRKKRPKRRPNISSATRCAKRWRAEVADKFKSIYERAAPTRNGVEGTPFFIKCQNRKHIDVQKYIGSIQTDGRMAALISVTSGQPDPETLISLRLSDFLGVAVANNHVTPLQALDIQHWADAELAQWKEEAKKALKASKRDMSVVKKAERKAEKIKLYYETVYLYLCHRPQIPQYNRVRTTVEIARDEKLKLPGVKAAIKMLKAEGKVVRERSQFGYGYAAAYKQDLPENNSLDEFGNLIKS